jgi:hypothetical protein
LWCRSSAHVTVLSQSYAEQDALKLIISSLQHLDKVTDDVFNKIRDRVRTNLPFFSWALLRAS